MLMQSVAIFVHVIVVTWARVVCLTHMYTRGPKAAGSRVKGVHIRQTTSAHVTTDMCHAINCGKHKSLTPRTIPSLTYIIKYSST